MYDVILYGVLVTTASASALTSAPAVAQKLFEGGDPPQSHECAPHSPHGYFGLDAEVVAYMAGVMLQ